MLPIVIFICVVLSRIGTRRFVCRSANSLESNCIGHILIRVNMQNCTG